MSQTVGIDRGEIPDLARAPNSLLEALEAHLIALEGGKPGGSRVTSPSTAMAMYVRTCSSTVVSTVCPRKPGHYGSQVTYGFL